MQDFRVILILAFQIPGEPNDIQCVNKISYASKIFGPDFSEHRI